MLLAFWDNICHVVEHNFGLYILDYFIDTDIRLFRNESIDKKNVQWRKLENVSSPKRKKNEKNVSLFCLLIAVLKMKSVKDVVCH